MLFRLPHSFLHLCTNPLKMLHILGAYFWIVQYKMIVNSSLSEPREKEIITVNSRSLLSPAIKSNYFSSVFPSSFHVHMDMWYVYMCLSESTCICQCPCVLMYSHVCGHTCVWRCMCMCMSVETLGWRLESPSVFHLTHFWTFIIVYNLLCVGIHLWICWYTVTHL